jgi:hypothetical protein
VETATEARYPFAAFDAYFDLMESGGAPTGLEYAALSKDGGWPRVRLRKAGASE